MSSNPVPYDTMLAALDAVDVAQRRELADNSKLSVSQKRDALLREIGAFYERQGLTVDPKIVEQGVDEFLSSELEFLPPKDPLLSIGATLWVRRKLVILSTVGLFVLAVLGLTAASSISWEQRRELQQIASDLEPDHVSTQSLVESVKGLIGPVQQSNHPRTAEWMASEAEFQRAADLWQKKTTDLLAGVESEQPSSILDLEMASRSRKIDQFREIRNQIYDESSALRSQADALKTAARFYIQYPSLLANLTSPLAGAGLPALLSSSFAQASAEARQALDTGNQTAFSAALARRESILQQAGQFKALSSKLNALTATLAQNVSDPDALKAARELATAAESAISSGQLDSAQSAVAQLGDYLDFVRSAFVLRIVSRPGMKSGIDRYYTDASGKRVAGYYVIVEALDASGRPIRQSIRNEEDGSLKQTSIWGERISKDVYEKIKKDKLDNGRIDQNVVGAKQAGSAKIDYTMIPTSEGRITRW